MNALHSSSMVEAPRTLRKMDFAKEIGVTPGRVSQMVRDGLPVEPNGRIDVARGKLWVKDNVDPTRSAAQSDQGALPFAAKRDASEERARLIKEQADALEIKNALARRNLLKADQVERTWADILQRIRSSVLAVPARLAEERPHLAPDDMRAIDRALRAALEDAANG